MTIKIILADSHQIMRQGIANLLAGEPDVDLVGEADDYATTVKLIQELSPQVVIMDIRLPDANGVDAIRRIHSEFPQIKIIAVSMHSDSLFVLNILNAGASGYLLKDCALEELIKAIRIVRTDKIYLSANLSTILVKDLASRITDSNQS